MSLIALIFCTGFVIYLLHLDRKQAPEVSRALWIPTLWMLYASSRSLNAWFAAVDATAESGSPVDQIFLIGLMILALLTLIRRGLSWSDVIVENPWMLLLLFYMFISTFWSDILFISFRRWIKELTAVVIAFFILTEPNPRQAVQTILRRTVYVLIPFSLLLIRYFPYYGRHYGRWSGGEMWIGVCLQKNGLSEVCATATLFLIWTLVRRRQKKDIPVTRHHTAVEVLLLIMTLFLVKGPPNSYSATSITVLSLGLIMFFAFLWMKKQQVYPGAKILMTIVVLGIVLGTAMPLTGGFDSVGALASLMGRNVTLTGRTEIWAGLLPSAMEHFFLGHGFGGYWTSITEKALGEKSAHNGYLEVLLEIGMFGLVITTMYLLSCCLKFHKMLSDNFDWAVFSICYLIMAVFHNIAESSFASFTRHIMVVLLFLKFSSATAGSQTPSMAQEELHR
jgi:O-antigen ligase